VAVNQDGGRGGAGGCVLGVYHGLGALCGDQPGGGEADGGELGAQPCVGGVLFGGVLFGGDSFFGEGVVET